MNIASGGMSWIDILYMLNNKLTTPPHRSVSVVKKINQEVMMMMKNGSISSSTFVFEQQF